MSLPRPPRSADTPIPNTPFTYEERYYLEGNQGHLPLGQGLYIDAETGAFTNINPNPWCTPAYPGIPVTYPPYGCNTEVNTQGVTDFSEAWRDCTEIVNFPCVDSSAVTDFYFAWSNCTGLTSFPVLDVSSGTNFNYAWQGCSSLTSFPANMFDSCLATNFTNAWNNCALDQTSVDNILVSLDTAGQTNGVVGLDGGTSSAPGAAGLAAKASLQAKGWSVFTN